MLAIASSRPSASTPKDAEAVWMSNVSMARFGPYEAARSCDSTTTGARTTPSKPWGSRSRRCRRRTWSLRPPRPLASGDDSRVQRRKPDAVALVIAVSAVLWGVIGLVVLFVAFIAVGRWLIRKGTDI